MDKLMQNLFGEEHDLAFELKREHADDSAGFVAELSKRPIKTLTEEEYKDACTVLPADALPEKILKSDEDLPDQLEIICPNGERCCVAEVPFIEGGYTKGEMSDQEWDDFLLHRRHVMALRVFFKDITQGYGDVAARYFQILPAKVRADVSEGGCTFKIDYPYPGKVNDKRNRVWFAERYGQAYANLRNILSV